jgi:putative colanic acid biosynthesis UDP-glucose lipid carrier transferase
MSRNFAGVADGHRFGLDVLVEPQALAKSPAESSRVKRTMDVAGALALLLFIAPLLLLVAIMVRLESSGPALFRQRRTGLRGETFFIYKFRTMVCCEDGARIVQATAGDPRITRLGAFLRKTSVDELPQLLNVLKGEMSLVGPRPHAMAHDQQYSQLIPGYVGRFAVRPGITGWAQTQGLRGETRTVGCMAARVDADLEYIAKWSLLLDLKILFRSAKIVFTSGGA